jgi:hypothetical protein
MIRRVLIVAVAAGLTMVLGVGAASAAPVTTTTTAKGVVDNFVDVVPSCEGGGPLYDITTTSNAIEHETVFDNGSVHATFTQTGTFVANPLNDPSLPSYTGKFTTWGGFNDNGRGAVNGTDTFSVRGTGSDGSTFSNHAIEHFNTTPTGAEFFFSHCHD